jgi:WD40 repeat protein
VANFSGEAKILPELSKCFVYGATFVTVTGTPVLCVVTSVGMQLWSGDGLDMMYLCALSTMMEQDPLEEDATVAAEKHYLRGITSVGASNIAIGCSNGSTFVFKVHYNRSSMTVELAHTLSSTNTARSTVVAVAGSEEVLVVGHDDGEICGYDSSNNFSQTCSLVSAKEEGVMATGLITSLIVNGDTIVAAYTTGHLRIYRASIEELTVEITAHVRCITGLVLHPVYRNIMVSCGEDERFHLWEFPDFMTRATSTANLISTHKVDNKLCTGVGFANVPGVDITPVDAIFVAFYDDDALAVYHQKL